MVPTPETSADVLIVGAGLAGATAASVLARQGVRVIVVDRRSEFPACFKAEKLEPDQSELLRKFGLLEALLPRTGRIAEVLGAEDGRVLVYQAREQFGIFYQDIVNQVRHVLPSNLELVIDRVQEIVTGGDVQRVTLGSGRQLTARLVVLAAGTTTDLQTGLGLAKRIIQKNQSLAFGFSIEPRGGGAFPFDAVTYYPDESGDRLAYLTLFVIEAVMRANLFVFWDGTDEVTRAFMRDPERELRRYFPKLTHVTGDFHVTTKVEACRIDLYRMESPIRPGLVLIGDAYQSVCPTTGTGLSKVLTDVDVLCHECVPQWLATPGMGAEKIAAFYGNARKISVDDHSLHGAYYNRQIASSETLWWRVHRMRRRWTKQFTGWRDARRSARKLTA